MKRFLNIVFALIFAAYCFGAVKNYKELKYPPLKSPEKIKPEIFKLKNGLTVLFLENHELPVVSGEIMFHCGSVCDPKGKEGLTELFSSAIRDGGNSVMSGDEMDEYLESTASTIEGDYDRTAVSVSFKCLTENFDKVFELFGATVNSPVFEPQKVEMIKAQMKSIIVRRNDNPQGIAARVFSRRVYGLNSPISKQSQLATVDAITIDDLKNYGKKYLVGANGVMYVYGDITLSRLKKMLEQHFGKMEKGKKAKLDLSAKPEKSGVYFVQREGITQSNIIFGNLVKMRKDSPDYPAAVMFSRILGGGFQSRFMKVIRRDMGLSYSPHAYIVAPYEYDGYFLAAINTKLQSTGLVIETAKKLIKDIQENGVKQDELQIVKDSFLNSYVFQFDSKEKQLAKAAYYTFYGYPTDFNERFFKAIKKVTAKDVQRVAKKYIDLDNLIITVVGDASKFDKPLNTFGKVYPVDITIPGLKEMQTARMKRMQMIKKKAMGKKMKEMKKKMKDKKAKIKEKKEKVKTKLSEEKEKSKAEIKK